VVEASGEDDGASPSDTGSVDVTVDARPASCDGRHDAGPPADASCRLGILLDQSASMNQIRSGTGRARCEDATRYAATVFNFFRCGQEADATGTCPNGTTADPALDFSMTDASWRGSGFDFVYSNPHFECENASAKQVNVWTFNGASTLQSATLGITTDPQGWVSLADNCYADIALQTIRALAATCANDTPLADALCAVNNLSSTCIAPTPNQSEQSAKLVLLTDGNENASAGACSGPDDSTGSFPFDRGSWQEKTFERLGGCPVDGWSIDTVLFLPSNGASTIDPETGQTTFPAKSVAFFQELDTITFGNFTTLTDDAPLSPLISR